MKKKRKSGWRKSLTDGEVQKVVSAAKAGTVRVRVLSQRSELYVEREG